MKYCTHCGKEITDEIRFCPNCGCATEEQNGEKTTQQADNKDLTTSTKDTTKKIRIVIIGLIIFALIAIGLIVGRVFPRNAVQHGESMSGENSLSEEDSLTEEEKAVIGKWMAVEMLDMDNRITEGLKSDSAYLEIKADHSVQNKIGEKVTNTTWEYMETSEEKNIIYTVGDTFMLLMNEDAEDYGGKLMYRLSDTYFVVYEKQD